MKFLVVYNVKTRLTNHDNEVVRHDVGITHQRVSPDGTIITMETGRNLGEPRQPLDPFIGAIKYDASTGKSSLSRSTRCRTLGQSYVNNWETRAGGSPFRRASRPACFGTTQVSLCTSLGLLWFGFASHRLQPWTAGLVRPRASEMRWTRPNG